MAALNTMVVEIKKTQIVMAALNTTVVEIEKTRIVLACPRKDTNRVGRLEHDTNCYKQDLFVMFLVVNEDPCC